MMFSPSLLYMVSTEMTNPDRDYLLATTVVQIVPMVVSLVATQAWAPLLTGYTSACSGVSVDVVGGGAVRALFRRDVSWWHPGSEQTGLMIIALAQVIIGVSNGGGNLAWNLGHNDFAPPDRAADYMGVHVMLTGLRGCIAPFLGSWLYLMPWIGGTSF